MQTVSTIGVRSAWTPISGATSESYELTTDDLATITASKSVIMRAQILDANGNVLGVSKTVTLK
jgi:hypothetical protein